MANFPVIGIVCVTSLACAVGTTATAMAVLQVHEIDTTSGLFRRAVEVHLRQNGENDFEKFRLQYNGDTQTIDVSLWNYQNAIHTCTARIVVHRGLVHSRFGVAVTFQWTLILSSAVAAATSVHFHTFCWNHFVMRLCYLIHIGHAAVADLHLSLDPLVKELNSISALQKTRLNSAIPVTCSQCTTRSMNQAQSCQCMNGE